MSDDFTIECPKCKRINHISRKDCYKCGKPLQPTLSAASANNSNSFISRLMNIKLINKPLLMWLFTVIYVILVFPKIKGLFSMLNLGGMFSLAAFVALIIPVSFMAVLVALWFYADWARKTAIVLLIFHAIFISLGIYDGYLSLYSIRGFVLINTHLMDSTLVMWLSLLFYLIFIIYLFSKQLKVEFE